MSQNNESVQEPAGVQQDANERDRNETEKDTSMDWIFDDGDPDSKSCIAYKALDEELFQLAKYWAKVGLDIQVKRSCYGSVSSSDIRLEPYCSAAVEAPYGSSRQENCR